MEPGFLGVCKITPIYLVPDCVSWLSSKKNCNLLSLQDPPAQTLVSFCSSFNLSQVISHPTRITDSTESLIDVALVSNTNLVKEAKVSPSSISDHEIILVVLNMKKSRPKPTYILTRSYKNYKRKYLPVTFQRSPGI